MNSKEKAKQTLSIKDIGKYEYPPCQWSYEIAQDYLDLLAKMEGKVLVPVEVIEFLGGAGRLEGAWFGETNPKVAPHKGRFWWRRYLRGATK